MPSPLIFSLIALILVINIPPSISSPKTPVKGFEARLIHRDSPESPLHNPKATHADLIESARQRTLARQNYFKRLMSSKPWQKLISAPIDLELGDYIMRFQIGTPKVDTCAFFDTTSGLVWLQCIPCEKCYNRSTPIYDPSNSSSFVEVRCGSLDCNITADTQCPDPNGICKYTIAYGDGRSSEGVLATETITLEHDGSSGSISLPNMIFGCGHSNVDPRSGYNPPGIVGLSREPSSLVGQISYPHVSYCISANNEGNHSSVKFGSVAVTTENATQTPLLTGPLGFYYVSLEGISVDGTMLDIPKSVFNMTPEGEGGVFMDTGTDHTQLVLPAFYAITNKIEDILSDFKSLPDVDRRFPVCYNDTNFRLDSTPEIVFQFTGLEFPLSANNTFGIRTLWDTIVWLYCQHLGVILFWECTSKGT